MKPSVTAVPAPKRLTREEKLALANRLYRECHTRCFWHMNPDLIVTEANLPTIIAGLRTHGGKKGALEAAQLIQ